MKRPPLPKLLPWWLLVALACAPVRHVPSNAAYVPNPPPEQYDDSHWAAVLRDHVRNGLVDYEGLGRNREPLERFLGLISVVGPQTTPELFRTPSDQICYYINAYNACVLRVVLDQYPVAELQRADTPRLEYQYTFRVDGRTVTLADLRRKLEDASEGDMRVRFCLSQASLGSPRLSEESYRPNTLREQMRLAVQRALSNPRLFKADHGNRRMYLWMPLINQKEKFLSFHQRVSNGGAGDLIGFLLLFADQEARDELQRARNYELLRMPIDRRLNDVKQFSRAP